MECVLIGGVDHGDQKPPVIGGCNSVFRHHDGHVDSDVVNIMLTVMLTAMLTVMALMIMIMTVNCMYRLFFTFKRNGVSLKIVWKRSFEFHIVSL